LGDDEQVALSEPTQKETSQDNVDGIEKVKNKNTIRNMANIRYEMMRRDRY